MVLEQTLAVERPNVAETLVRPAKALKQAQQWQAWLYNAGQVIDSVTGNRWQVLNWCREQEQDCRGITQAQAL